MVLSFTLFNTYRPSHGMNAISSVRRVIRRAAEQLAELDIIPLIRRWYATKASGERSSLWDTPAGETGYGKFILNLIGASATAR